MTCSSTIQVSVCKYHPFGLGKQTDVFLFLFLLFFPVLFAFYYKEQCFVRVPFLIFNLFRNYFILGKKNKKKTYKLLKRKDKSIDYNLFYSNYQGKKKRINIIKCENNF